MYSLDCDYSGMDPNYEVTEDGIGIGELAIDFLSF